MHLDSKLIIPERKPRFEKEGLQLP